MTQDRSSATEREAIHRLVELARKDGRPDAFMAKRNWSRYMLGLPLDITADCEDPNAVWAGIMHNVSGGGIGFWSKRDVKSNTRVFVREYSRDGGGAWIECRVAHSTLGLQGFLIGARFENPAPREQPTIVETPVELDRQTAQEPGSRALLPRRSLSTKCAFACATTSCLGIVFAAWFCHTLWPQNWLFWLVPISTLLASGMGAFVGWCIVDDEIRFLKGLREAVCSLARSGGSPVPVPETPSRELGELRQAFMELAAQSRRREGEQRLQREKLEELNRIKSNILSVVSHDLRTPLTSILLYAQMLKEELQSLAEEDQKRFLDIIAGECNRLSRLVDDLLEVQRLESDRIQWDIKPQDLSETIRTGARVFEAMAMGKEIAFTVECPEPLPTVEADSEKISQVLSNLLSNAMKYTQSGGEVALSVEVRGANIVLCVADNGPGIPRDQWDVIFDRFTQLTHSTQSRNSGVGLGLNIVKRIVERHGGAVWVDSEVGEGSRFFVSLPTKVKRPLPESDPSDAPVGRVLVCDADPELAAMIAQSLQTERYEVRLAYSGKRLLAQAEEGQIDVVITDVLLPDMDSSELLAHLVALPHRTFRLIVHSYACDTRQLKRQGVDAFLERPTSRKELLQAVTVAMQKRVQTGLTVLLVGRQLRPLAPALSRAGHLPIIAEDFETASRLVCDYSLNAALIAEGELDEQWERLREIGIRADDPIRLMIVCENLQKRQKLLAEEYGLQTVILEPGKESVVAAEVSRLQESYLERMRR
ncbi:MAG: response regulator [Phycisphaerae bacterium]|nr:response regulator [Phycisphaerae bacterium]